MMRSMQVDGPFEETIGTLTGWQMLANQVASSSSAQQHALHSSEYSSGDLSDHVAAHRPSMRQRSHLCSPSSCSSSISDDSGHSGLGIAAVTSVAPRPHHCLYKEYKIQDEIGSGGFGRVCRARRMTDGKVVVVKEIKTTNLSAKQKAATMDEVEVLSKLNHPNIVKYHDCFMDHVYINIVMEYCNAGDLAGLLKARNCQLLPEEEVMTLFVQICLALQYVHAAGVLHRDLKSSNVLIASHPNLGGMPLLKLGDFGVAKINSEDSSMASTIVGTPQYLSPEMCDNKPYGKKSDIWALGCILYELCSLRKAFEVGSGGISGIILKIMRGSYNPIPVCYSEGLKQLLGIMLQTNPQDRPSVLQLLNNAYVRPYLSSYLSWAHHVPEAHPEILSASLGSQMYKGLSGSARQQSQVLARTPANLSADGSGGTTPTSAAALGEASTSAAAAGGEILSPATFAAAAAAAGLTLRKSSKQSNGASSLTPSGSAALDSPTGSDKQAASAACPSAARHTAASAAPAGPLSNDLCLQSESDHVLQTAASQQQQQQEQRPQPRKAMSDTGGEHTAAAVSRSPCRIVSTSWLAGRRDRSSQQQQQQQAPQDQQEHRKDRSVSASAQRWQGDATLERAAVGSAGSYSSCSSSCYSVAWLPSSCSSGSSKISVAQEQLEGLRRLRGLKAKLQVHPSKDNAGLLSLMSLDSDVLQRSP